MPSKKSASRSTARARSPQINRDVLWAALLFVAVVLVYSPGWWAGFIWDDAMFVAENPALANARTLADIWTTRTADICPLTLTLFHFVYPIFGSDPLPYHIMTVLLHAATAIVLWRVLLALQIPGAWLGAALWALHPVQVESVAWVSEAKNTLSGLFFMLSALSYTKMLRIDASAGMVRRRWGLYGLAVLFCAMAMASKTSTITLPIVLGLCAWWIEGRWNWRRSLDLLPLLAMSALAAALTLWTINPERIHIDPHITRSGLERLAAAGDVFWFYLGKLLWPHPLMLIYPQWAIDTAQIISYLPLAGAIALGVWCWLKRGAWGRPYFFAMAYYVALILPALGLVDHAFVHLSLVADHLQYLAGVGPLALLGAGLTRLSEFRPFRELPARLALAGAVLVALAALSWSRAWAFQSGITIWSDALAKNRNCWVAYGNLGAYTAFMGDVPAAVRDFENAIKLNPYYAEAYSNLGYMLVRAGKYDDARVCYARALEIAPDFPQAHDNLGEVLTHQGKISEAIQEFKKALELDPSFQIAQDNLDKAEALQRMKQEGHVQPK